MNILYLQLYRLIYCSQLKIRLFALQASHILAEWCCKELELFQGKKVLELGAGLGLTGLTVVQSCRPSSFVFTDLHEAVLTTLRENVLINLCKKTQDELQHQEMSDSVDWVRKVYCINYCI